jgi:predicted small lipoprotein YifL
MSERVATQLCIAALLAGVLAGCGQKGDLYLPDAPREIVTRPAPTTPASENTEAPNSPQTVDSPAATPSPTPEVTAPVGTPESEEAKKAKGATTPPPK